MTEVEFTLTNSGNQTAHDRALTSFRTCVMVFHMKTTLIIPDPIFRNLKRRAAERGETLSKLVTEFLRQGLRETRNAKRPPTLPVFKMGPPEVDIANREALYRVLDADRHSRLYGARERD